MIFFLGLGFLSPLIGSAFDEQYTTYDMTKVDDINNNGDALGIISIVSAIFLWVVNAPLWLNLFITVIRVIFWVIVYDKFRGVSS